MEQQKYCESCALREEYAKLREALDNLIKTLEINPNIIWKGDSADAVHKGNP